MTYRDREKKRIAPLRDGLVGDPGGGEFQGVARDFVLADAALNLWRGLRADARAYFRDNGIGWWKGDDENDLPTGHLLSSQVACVNHLFPLRADQAAASAVLRAIDAEIETAEIVDDGYVEFEFIGEKPYLGERSFSRGSHCTSIDAAMIGRRRDGARVVFPIEWKYTEFYKTKDLHIAERARIYDHLIEAADSPFVKLEPRTLYYEPFYQLMRQTLLARELVRAKDHGCTAYVHVHVAPKANRNFHDAVTAPALEGATVAEAWRRVLKTPTAFVSTTPEKLLSPAVEVSDSAWIAHMRARYWDGDRDG